ncbi:MAG TPA: DUF2393 family protein [Terracidiphilus sp.]|nr:DUF2393 family protein [Terracidiphilus sp.]
MSVDEELKLVPSREKRDRIWLPLAIAAFVVAAVVVIFALALHRDSNTTTTVEPVNAAQDAYAANLSISGLAMSESSNFVGNKITYVDGHITNQGSRTVTGLTVQTLFYDTAQEVAQNVTQPLKLIRTRQPYIDVEPVGANPIKPGEERDFRLIFDGVSQDWNGAYPQLKILHVDFQ